MWLTNISYKLIASSLAVQNPLSVRSLMQQRVKVPPVRQYPVHVDIAHDAHPLDKNGNQNQSSAKLQDPTEKITVVQSQKSEDANEVVECHNQSSNILSDLEMSFDDTKLNQSQTPSLNVQSSAEIFTINHWSQESVEACCSNEPSINSSRSSFNLHDSKVDFQSNQLSIPSLISPRMPNLLY